MAPLLRGGAQQRGLRAGTQDVPGAAAFATALELAERERPAEAIRLGALRDRLVAMGRAGAMTDDEVAVFVQHYERLTRHIAREMPPRADIVVALDEDRRSSII